MTEQEKRLHRCCFTGHRPEKLSLPEAEVIAWLETETCQAIADGFTTFISGMARGVDIWAAEIVLKLRDGGEPIHLICACPYPGFDRSWSQEWRDKYQRILREADLVRDISGGYNRYCFQRRNEWMVDHSARVIAAFDGKPGGTKNTIEYAVSHGVFVVTIKEINL